MFWFTQGLSSGSYNQCLAKIAGLVQKCALVQMSVLWIHIRYSIKKDINIC